VKTSTVTPSYVFSISLSCENRDVFLLPKNFGNSVYDVNGTKPFGLFHWKLSGINGISEKVFRFPGGNFPMEICVPFTDFSSLL